MRDNPIVKANAPELLNDVYVDFIAEYDFRDFYETTSVTPDVNSNVVLPEDFGSFDTAHGGEPSIYIDMNSNYLGNRVMILQQKHIGDIEELRRNASANYETYFTLTGRPGSYLLEYVAGDRPRRKVTFSYKKRPEELDSDSVPQLIHPDFHNILIYGLAIRLLQNRDLSDNERVTHREVMRTFEKRIDQYYRHDNKRAKAATFFETEFVV